MDEWQETEWESTVSNLINVDIYETVLAAIGENSAFAHYDRCHYRLCFDKEIKSDGTRYKISCELEYPAQSKYDDICRYEQKLIELSLGFLETCTFDPDPMTYQEMFSCVVPKIQLWNCFNPHDRFKWAYKWNGIKAKMIMRNETDASLWPDANNITSVKCTGDLSKLFGLCLQVEILEDRIVLVEFVAASFGMEIYSVEPNSNVEALESLRVETLDSSLSTNEDIVFGTVGDKPLHIQQFYKSILPTNYDRRKHDGFIIVQQDLIIKWKVPTIDVKCIGQGRYIVQDDTLGTDVIGGVYELSPDLKILRQRKDRITHSTEKEFRTFLKSVLLMRLSGSDGLRQHHNVMAYSDKE
ncbi:uncharacterized protein [Bemisia tabaci]|uniref:uncharacterized protein n=1 Tax=Bemisia tabaci TaxID=7038 RepID=UPI003B284AFD